MTDTPPQREELREQVRNVLGRHAGIVTQPIYEELVTLIHTESQRQSVADRLELIETIEKSLHRIPRAASQSPDEVDMAFTDGWKQAIHDTRDKLNEAKERVNHE